MGYKIGVDVGGTFTDFLLVDEDGDSWVHKTPSTPKDPSIGLLQGLAEMAEERRYKLEDFIKELDLIVHGTTVTTNAVLTGKGAKTGVLTTKGFRDILYMRRGFREERYDNKVPNPIPLVPRYLRRTVQERVDYKGEVLIPLNEADLQGALSYLAGQGVEALAICFMHSYANPEHEEQAARVATEALPGGYLTVSSHILPQIRLYDRVSTTVMNSYVGPIIQRYLTNLVGRLKEIDFRGTLLIMQSNGGVMSPEIAIKSAASTLLSGPASGPVAGIHYAGVHQYDDCITMDMGGTSFDAALVRAKTPLVITEGNIGKWRLGLPMLDINTIGAGGGSIAWIDPGILLHVGPQSAGADPGPACYGLGGEEPTVTDADLVLGYLDPGFFLGGRMKLNSEKARQAIEEKIAKPLKMGLIEAAAGIYQVINVNMATGVREVSVKRGYDPRDFPLVVAGGAGPVHAGMIASELEIPLVIVPKESSIFCAAGMLMSDLRHDFVRTYKVSVPMLAPKKFQSLFEEMREEGEGTLFAEGVPKDQIHWVHSADMRYVRQHHEINIVLTRQEIVGGHLDVIAEKFHAKHEELYGYSTREVLIELINLRLIAFGRTKKPRFKEDEYKGKDCSKALKGKREIYLPEEKRFATAAVLDGHRMGYGNRVTGPAIIEQRNTTILVLPGYDLVCDRFGSYVMYLKSREEEMKDRLLKRGEG